MKSSEINIRDPFVMLYGDKYYLYGTRAQTAWGEASGFDCYVSEDLEEFEGPVEVFRRPEGFFADRYYWAPECYSYNGCFWLVVTLGSQTVKKGIYLLRSSSPTGPFELYGKRLTPEDMTCIDGTLYFEDGKPYLIFSHSFEDGVREGEFDLVRLTSDLKPSGDIKTLISAATADWARPVPFAKAEFGMDGDVFFSDGPSIIRGDDGRLYMAASSWGQKGYAVGVAVSGSGSVDGPWHWQKEALYPENGGHGMFFEDKLGRKLFALHYPNDKLKEHPIFKEIVQKNGELRIRD